MDVKHLPSWQPGKSVKVLSIIDLATRHHVVEPFPEGAEENAETLRALYLRGWVRHYGVPDEIWLDSHRAHLSDHFLAGLAADGTASRFAAGQAHWQMGLVERHGQTVERKLLKMLPGALSPPATA